MYQLAARDVQLQPPERKAQKMPESNKHDFLVQYTFTFAERQYCAYPIDYQRVYKDRRRKSDLIPLTLPDHQAHLSDAFFPFFFVFCEDASFFPFCYACITLLKGSVCCSAQSSSWETP